MSEVLVWTTGSGLPLSGAFSKDATKATFHNSPSFDTYAYKKVANKVRPVPTSLPEHCQVVRKRPEDPLLTLPPLLTHPPLFTSGTHLTAE